MTPRPVKLSKAVRREIEMAAGKQVVVAAVVSVRHSDIDQYAHLGLRLDKDGVITGEPAPPPRTCGPQARRNLDGWEVKRTDLEKETRDISNWAPNWHSSGYHLVSRTIEAWPVEHHSAKLLTISAGVLNLPTQDATSIRFRVDQPLHRDDPDFERDLAFNLRLLREAVGDAHVHSADFTDDDFANIQRVDWELLPAGTGEDQVLKRLATRKGITEEKLNVAAERLRVLDRLNHDGYIVGAGKFARYFGAKFGTQLVVLENLDYGNALYAFEENWDSLTQLSRTELIKRRDPGIHRIPHTRGWQSVVRQLLRKK
jgi:hypothetical protein